MEHRAPLAASRALLATAIVPLRDAMILAAYICEHGAIVSQATNHATSPDEHGAGTSLDSLLHLRAQELSHAVGSSAVKRVVVRRHDELLLFCLAQGAQAFVCACTDAPERAFAAFCFLADVCARWSNQTERLAFESVLRAQMVHYSSANIIGAELLRSHDEPAHAAEAEALQARTIWPSPSPQPPALTLSLTLTRRATSWRRRARC